MGGEAQKFGRLCACPQNVLLRPAMLNQRAATMAARVTSALKKPSKRSAHAGKKEDHETREMPMPPSIQMRKSRVRCISNVDKRIYCGTNKKLRTRMPEGFGVPLWYIYAGYRQPGALSEHGLESASDGTKFLRVNALRHIP